MDMEKGKWHKPTDREKLQEAHEHFNLPRVTRRKKRLDWWDRIKISFYEEQTEAKILPPQPQPQLPPSNEKI